MRKLLLAVALAALPLTAAPVAAGPSKALLAMTPEAFRQGTTLHDDSLELHATLSTEKAHRRGPQLFSNDQTDNHLRAIVDKRTGATRYEVRQTVQYYGSPRDYHTAHVATPEGVKKVALSEARHDNPSCPAAEDDNFQCPRAKHLAFEVDESVLRSVASGQANAGTDHWAFKFKDATGSDLRAHIVPAEAAGLLAAVDAYKSTLRVADAGAAPAVSDTRATKVSLTNG